MSSTLSRVGRAYVRVVIALGLSVVLGSVYEWSTGPISPQWYLLAALTLVSGSATVKLPSSYASVSVSEVFVFIAFVLYGPSAGTLIVALDGLVISFWLTKRHHEVTRAL